MIGFRFSTSALLLTLAVTLSGCSTLFQSAPEQAITIDSGTLSSSSEKRISQYLYQQYQTWRGTPYAWGGLSKRGVDCSGFVYLTLRDQFGTYVPRTTKQQAQAGYYVDEDDLEAGDLVFFKTSYKVRHVGIYLNHGKFLHASTSSGVIISRLDNPYWQEHYWHGRRIK